MTKERISYSEGNAGHPGTRLKKLRSVLGYTRARMAGRLGMSEGGYSKYEGGLRYPSSKTLGRLIEEFDVSMDWLLFNRGPMYFGGKASLPEVSELKEQLRQAAVQNQQLQETHQKEVQELSGRMSLQEEIRELIETMESDEVLFYEILAYFKRYQRDRQIEGKEEK